MERFVAHCVVLCLTIIFPFAAEAADLVSTRCEESELTLPSGERVSRLGRCGDQTRTDLLWHLDRIDQIEGSLDGRFDRDNRGAGGVVYVMDTGVLASHQEFAGPRGSRVVTGFDVAQSVPLGASLCLSPDRALAPCFDTDAELAAASHGTGVASLIAGRNVGVAPEASIVSVRVMNERGLATTRTYLDGLDAIIRHAWSSGAPEFRTAVVNISGWVLERVTETRTGVVAYSAVEKKMLDMIAGVDATGARTSAGKRFLFVVSANNVDGGCGRSGVVDRFPAILGREVDGIITVGGLTRSNEFWRGGCRGGVEILAPAQSIFSATITAPDHYRGRIPSVRSGTSFAAPIISGIAARLLTDRPDLTPQQLEAWITSTPSRAAKPHTAWADGKVAYTVTVPPARGGVGVAALAP